MAGITPLAPHSIPPGEACLLLVEDDEANRYFMGELLGRLGFTRLIHACHGEEALDTLARNKVDLVLMDCQMPVMDGFEATRRLRHGERKVGAPRIPVIALTAYALEEDRQACLQAGMDDFLAKPVAPDALRESLARWLDLLPGKAFFSPERSDGSAHGGLVVPTLDQAAFSELCRMMGQESMEVLVTTFLQGLPDKVAGLIQARERGDREVTRRLAHTLKSNAVMMKAVRLAGLCLEVESLARTDMMAEAACQMPRIRDEAEQVADVLRTTLQGIRWEEGT